MSNHTQNSEITFSMFSSPESRGMQQGLGFGAPPRELNLLKKYQPTWFAGFVGQEAAINRLTAFVANPYPAAFVLAGGTGTGKSSMGRALANEMGVDPNWGFNYVRSGELDAEAVNQALRQLRFVTPGDKWKLLLCDEAEAMSPKAKQLWLSALEPEQLCRRSVIVFTTNFFSKFERRFLDRCKTIQFESNPAILMPEAQVLMDRIWTLEDMEGPPPDVRTIPDLVDGGELSLRRVVLALESAKEDRLVTRPLPTAEELEFAALPRSLRRPQSEIDRPAERAASRGSRAAVVDHPKLTIAQYGVLKKIAAHADPTGFHSEKKPEVKTIDVLLGYGLLKNGKKPLHYLVATAGMKYLLSL